MRVVLFLTFHTVVWSLIAFDAAGSEDVNAFPSSAPQLALRFRQEQDDAREERQSSSRVLATSRRSTYCPVARGISPPPRPPHTTSTSTPPLHLSPIRLPQYFHPADLTLARATNTLYPGHSYTLGLLSALHRSHGWCPRCFPPRLTKSWR
ncbi:hypothetical protein MSAN_01811300 [Mycena sanguinolenta]|uniref:Secreted protein n=1 Tax=Mycena sanguinolenta TaxID=230812 RepID=A0A8H6XUW1_9AGAR|nr:hypothetical protein MSAN_01811300 [Mycena sanguinolenta]